MKNNRFVVANFEVEFIDEELSVRDIAGMESSSLDKEYIHVFRLWLDSLDDSLNSNSNVDADEDESWLPKDIYGNSEIIP